MSVINDLRSAGPFIGNGSTSVFPFTFRVFTAADVVVTLYTIATGVSVTLAIGGGCTLALNADQDTNPGGTVTYLPSGVPMTSDYEITVTTNIPTTQTTDITNSGGFFPRVINAALDRIVVLIQQLRSRQVTVPVGDPSSGGLELPSLASRRNKALGFDAAGQFLAIDTTLGGITDTASVNHLPLITGAGSRVLRSKLQQDFPTVRDFYANGVSGNMVDPTGAIDSTAGIQKAIDAGVDFVPPGTYLIDPIYFPNGSPRFLGQSMGAVVFVQKTPNTTLFQKVASAGVADGSMIGNFSIKPHASGSTAPAFKCTGFRFTDFAYIKGLSNGTKGFYSLFDIAAYPYLCYGCSWVRPVLDTTLGYTYGLDFNNGGTGLAVNNANLNSVVRPWFNANTGMLSYINARKSAKTDILCGLFEGSAAGVVAIFPGTGGRIAGNWFELTNAGSLDLDFYGDAQGAGNFNLVESNYFSVAHDVNFYNAQFGNVFMNNTELSPLTNNFVNNSYRNAKLQALSTLYAPTAPTIAYLTGQTGVLTLVSATTLQKVNQVSGDTTFKLVYTWTAGTATTTTQFAMNEPTGFSLKAATVLLSRGASGEVATANMEDSNLIRVWNKYNDSHTLTVIVTYSRTQ